MYVCMYVCMCMHTRVYVHIYQHYMNTQINTHVCIYTHPTDRACSHVLRHVHAYTRMYLHSSAYATGRQIFYMHIHHIHTTHINIHARRHTHTHTHTHTIIQTQTDRHITSSKQDPVGIIRGRSGQKHVGAAEDFCLMCLHSRHLCMRVVKW